MGLLDDAIREHLDLKRRRGADPAEVARMEREALGPVRREPTPADTAEERPEGDAEQAAEALPEPRPHPADEGFPADDRTRVLAPEERHEGPHGDPLAERAQHESGSEPVPDTEPAEPPQRQPDPGPTDVVDQPTTEYRVEDHHDDEDAQAAPPRDDVLEETPDFLQETPEHDRLWFEQRPPRDFDFDG